MKKRDNVSPSHGQFTLSYELLCLIQWMLEHESEKIKKIVSKALEYGLKEELQRMDELTSQPEFNISEDMQYAVVEFFSLMEGILVESMHEYTVKKAMEQNLMPAIEQIDTTMCDNNTVKDSIEKATNKIGLNPKENPKELLCKELIKRWRPAKGGSLH